MKEVYLAPEVLPVILSSEAIICTSPNDILAERQDYGDPIPFVW